MADAPAPAAPDLDAEEEEDLRALHAKLAGRTPRDASHLVAGYPEPFLERVLERLEPAPRTALLAALPRARRELLFTAASPANRRRWLDNDRYPEGTVGRLMEPALGVFPPHATVAEAVARLRLLTGRALITYLYVADADDDRFVGVVVMRDMLLSPPDRALGEIMFQNTFALTPGEEVVHAMQETMLRHYPVYPVVDAQQRIVGLVRGQLLFEAQAVVLSAQAGAMVGVPEEERLGTPWGRSLRFRQPWLQVNLLGTFLAALVVGGFGHTLARVALLAACLPVLLGQSATVGNQARAVAVRALTLGELTARRAWRLAGRELCLGLVNGFLTGLTAGLAIYAAARWQGSPRAARLAWAVVGALTASSALSGGIGALTPTVLRRLGHDPAAASGIVLTALAGAAGVGVLLGLAAWLVP